MLQYLPSRLLLCLKCSRPFRVVSPFAHRLLFFNAHFRTDCSFGLCLKYSSEHFAPVSPLQALLFERFATCKKVLSKSSSPFRAACSVLRCCIVRFERFARASKCSNLSEVVYRFFSNALVTHFLILFERVAPLSQMLSGLPLA